MNRYPSLAFGLFSLILPLALSTSAPAPARQVPAFPGAEGFGAWTPGGRGGKVYAVTNLRDRGPGSLRAAVQAEGPRIVVFRVSGNIELESGLTIRNPFITIAGQTAPGDGVCLKNHDLKVATHDVVLRYLRVRPGDVAKKELDALGGRGCRNVVVDHCSASWSVDECVSFYNNQNVTVQWCLFSESLYESVHAKGRHGYGGIWGGNDASYHHNLLAHHTSRNPRFSRDDRNVDLRNNVIYNWGFNSAYGGEGATVNIVANFFKAGPATRASVRDRILDGSGAGGRWHIASNFVAGFPAVTRDNWRGVHRPYAPIASMRSDCPFSAAPVTTHAAGEAYRLVLARAGASLRRDAVDARVVREVSSGTAQYGESYAGGGKGIIDSQRAVGGWPALRSAPAPPDGDGDGMPDAWERARGLNPRDMADGPRDRDGDGYTNVEEALNRTDPARFIDYTRPENNRHSLHEETVKR